MISFFLKWFLHKQQLHRLELHSLEEKVREDLVEIGIIMGDMKIDRSLPLPKTRTGAIMCTCKGQVQNKLEGGSPCGG